MHFCLILRRDERTDLKHVKVWGLNGFGQAVCDPGNACIETANRTVRVGSILYRVVESIRALGCFTNT